MNGPALFPGFGRRSAAEDSDVLDFFKEEDAAPAAACACGASRDEWLSEELTTCLACGAVVERPLDSGAEYRFFGGEDRSGTDPCRVGAPTDTRFPNSTLGTMILNHSQGGNKSNRIAMARVRRYHTWNLLPYKERSLLQVFEQIFLTATNHGFDGHTMDIAKQLYITLVEHCDKRGMSRTSIVASCVYSALKKIGQPRKPKEIAAMFHLQMNQFTKSLKYFQEVLCMANQRGLLVEDITPTNLPTTRASDYLANPLSRLPISRAVYTDVFTIAKQVADYIEENELCPENMPPSLASGVIAFTLAHLGHTDITTERIAATCEVSEGTLNKCLKKITSFVEAGKIPVLG
jgi:transcription initiation factor TFIIIB Brf1 subunit/transcription initiation factor TFIIB